MVIDNANNAGPIIFNCEGTNYKLFANPNKYYYIDDIVWMNQLAVTLGLENIVCWPTKKIQRWLRNTDKELIAEYVDEIVPVICSGDFYDFQRYVIKLSKIKKDYYAQDDDDVPYWAR